VLSYLLIAAHQQRYLVIASPTVLVFNVTLNLLLIPSHGAEGAAVALVCSEALGAIAAATWLHRITSYPLPMRFAIQLLPAVALTVAACWVVRHQPVLVQMPTLGIVYAVSVLVFGPVRLRELRMLIGRDVTPRPAAVGEPTPKL
jgi:O-antigen/teichoic acid export membrane protein